MKKNLIEIAKYYNLAWISINNNDIKQATKVIHNEMPVKLYDMSLNIEYGTSRLKTDEKDEQAIILFEETKHLIEKVNKKLAEISTEGIEETLVDRELTLEEMSTLASEEFEEQF